ncbi:MAG TPA: OmpA family protein [Bacteroidia bacterium]|nr:OmpA family protein [Bacteroidia bacterium]
MKRFLLRSLPAKLILFGSVVLFLSGCADYYYRQGNKMYDQLGYTTAIDYYMKSLAKKETTAAREKLAECYLKMNNYVKAEEHFAIALKDTVCPCKAESKLHYAQILMRSGKYDEAKTMFDLYLKAMPNDSSAMMLRQSCDMVSELTEDSTLFIIEAAKFNTEGSTFSPAKYGDGLMIAAERGAGKKNRIYEWTGRSFLDVMTVKSDGKGGWEAPVPLRGDVNGDYHEGPSVMAAGDSVIYFTRNNYVKKKVGKSVTDVVNLKIYKASKKDTLWTNITSLPFNSNDYSCGHPALTADGNTMYFVSDMPGGVGGTDIWMATKSGDVWGTPVNAGKTINTPYNEMFPVLQKDDVMFFSSEGHHTLGGLDVFKTVKNNGEWSAPENMKTPVNSSSDDFGVMIKDTTILEGYVSSNRNSKASGIDQVYTILQNLHFSLKGTVVDVESQAAIEAAMVILIDKKTNAAIDSMPSGSDGSFVFALQPETDYIIQATKTDYFTDMKEVSTMEKKKSEDFFVKLELKTLWKPIVLRNILYDFDKWNIRKDAEPELNKLAKIMKDNPKINVELSSHCDIRANYDYNLKLSQRRAESAVAYIVAHGIPATRITSRGYAWTKPFVTTKDDNRASAPAGTELTPKFIKAIKDKHEQEELHQLNRRTEFIVTKVDK